MEPEHCSTSEIPNIDTVNPVDYENKGDAGMADATIHASVRAVLGQEALLGPLVSTMVKLLLETPALLNELAVAISNAIKEETISKIREEVVPDIKQELYESISMDAKSSKHDIAKLHDDIQELQSINRNLAKQLDDAEQYSRRNCLLLHGLPESKDENTTTKSLNHINNHLKLNITHDQIDRTHRIGKRHTEPTAEGKPKHRPIIIKFVSYQQRQQVFRVKKVLKGTKTVITESLTNGRMDLLRNTQQMVRSGYFKDTWTLDGRVVALTNDGKKVTIAKKSDLD